MLRAAILARHLGPWAGSATPAARRETSVEGGTQIAWYLPPGRAAGAVLVAQGLHYLGADDPRLDRFCRALAASGCVVACPLLSDYLDLRVAPGAARDLEAGLAALERRVPLRPSLFSISFGSLPALTLAAAAPARLRGLLLFGGYADFGRTIRAAVGAGPGARPSRDPLNGPVVLRHVVPWLEGPLERAGLERAMAAMARRTWGRPELKRGDARAPHALRLAATLGAAERRVFLASTGLEPGAEALLEEGLARAGDALAFADVAPLLGAIRTPTWVVHGRDDDVIPFEEGAALAAAIPGARFVATGLYGHTAASAPSPRALLAEAEGLAAILSALARL